MAPKWGTFLLLGLLVSLAGCLQAPPYSAPTPSGSPLPTVFLSVGPSNFTLAAQVADTPAAQQLGLMYRPSMPESQGMLFVFPKPSHLTFWMAHTTLPLEILFLNSNGTIVDLQEMAPCPSADTTQCPIYTSTAPALYALELNSNFGSRHGVAIGQTIKIPSPY